MTPMLFIVAAALGAVGRHVLAHVACSWQALLLANTAGSALFGWLVASDVSDPVLTVVGIGFCGALTTFSSFALEVRALGWRLGAAYTVSTLVCVAGAASIGATF